MELNKVTEKANLEKSGQSYSGFMTSAKTLGSLVRIIITVLGASAHHRTLTLSVLDMQQLVFLYSHT